MCFYSAASQLDSISEFIRVSCLHDSGLLFCWSLRQHDRLSTPLVPHSDPILSYYYQLRFRLHHCLNEIPHTFSLSLFSVVVYPTSENLACLAPKAALQLSLPLNCAHLFASVIILTGRTVTSLRVVEKTRKDNDKINITKSNKSPDNSHQTESLSSNWAR